MHTLFWILFPYRLLQNIEYGFLCYTIGSWLSSSYTTIYTVGYLVHIF